jgi:protoheme IX farnesyltransferase
LSAAEVLVFGAALSVLGVLDLTLFTNFLTGFLAVVTLVTYLFLYTPLKRITPWSTVVGGIPGALPPVIGWTAVRNEITLEAWVLFAVLFFWQMPHFLSLAWMYRRDYARAGYKLLTVIDSSGSTTSIHMIVCSTLLLIASIAQGVLGASGLLYIVAASLLGTSFIAATVHLAVSRTNEAARRVFFASLIYLPVLLIFMVIDKL